MVVTGPETRKQEWTAFGSAPFIMLAAIAVVGSIVWWVRGKVFETQIAKLVTQRSVLNERLRLGVDALAA